jgi:hypothetical protein
MRSEDEIQRYNGRGKTGLGKGWPFRGKTGLWKREQLSLFWLHLLFSSSAFGIAGMREEAAGLQCGRRILLTQVPRIGHALKLPNNDNKKKKIKKFYIHIKK